jgi:hypothetical protein
MGMKKTEGGAVNIVAPGSTAMAFGELYRVDGWTGLALRTVTATDTERGLALETDCNSVWYFSIPSGLAAARGDLLWWATGTGYKVGATDLVAAGTSGATGPAVKVEEAVDSSFVIAGRVMQLAKG